MGNSSSDRIAESAGNVNVYAPAGTIGTMLARMIGLVASRGRSLVPGRWSALGMVLAFWLGGLAAAMAQGPDNVLLVVNRESKDSKNIGDYYRRRRAVAGDHICTIQTLDQDEITRVFFEDEIRKPILDCLSKRGLQDRVLYIVLTKGIPVKIKNTPHQNDQASVDSELTLLYDDLMGKPHPLQGSIPNPYFVPHARGQFVRFSHREFPIYLVTRLDGYDVGDVRALIDRGLTPSREGRFVLDLDSDDNRPGNAWLREAAARLKEAGIPEARIRLETSPAFLRGEKDVLGYASWGSNDHSDHSRFLGNTWVNSALMVEFVSSDARTFERPPKNWTIGRWSDPPGTFFKDSPQSLIADYIHEGVTGASGNVYEPYLWACARPQIVFPAYVRGHNLAESFYAALPALSWQTVVIGDPLVKPFPGPELAREDLNPPKDPASGLPRFFAERLARAKAVQQKIKNRPQQ